MFGKFEVKLVHDVPPFAVIKTLLPAEYPLKTTHALLGSEGSIVINSGEAEPTGTAPVTFVQVAPALVVLKIPELFKT